MSRSTKDECFLEEDFAILVEILKRLPDQHKTAALEDVVRPYQNVLESRDIDVENDEYYWSCVMRLMQYRGRSWREKLLNAIPSGHQRHNSQLIRGPQLDRRDAGNRSVIRQRLDGELAPSLMEKDEVPELTSEHKNALVGRYKLYIRHQAVNILRHTYEKWLDCAQRHQELRIGHYDYAQSVDNFTLKRQAFEIWYRAWQENVEFYEFQEHRASAFYLSRYYKRWENATIEKKQGQYLARMVAERKIRHQEAESRVRNNRAQHLFEKWRRRLLKTDDLELRAFSLYDGDLQRRTWKHWFFRACDRRTIEFRNMSIKRHSLQAWKVKLYVSTIMYDKADVHRDAVILATSFEHWRLVHAQNEQLISSALLHERRSSLTKYLSRWRQFAVLARHQALVENNVYTRIVRSLISRWRQRLTHRERVADDIATTRRRSLFKAWRQEAQASQLLYQHDAGLFQRVVKAWLIQTRRAKVERNCDYRLAHRYMEHWRVTHTILRNRLDLAEDEVCYLQSFSIQAEVLDIMRDRLMEIDEQYDLAEAHYAKTIATFALAKIKAKMEDVSFQISRALKFELYTSRKRTLRSWVDKLYHKRTRRREEHLIDFIKLKENDLAQKSLHRWHDRILHLKFIQSVSDNIRQERDRALSKYFYTAWCDRHLDLFELGRLADDHARIGLARSLCDKLYLTSLKWRQDRVTANLYYASHFMPIVRRILLSWRARHQALEEQVEKADLMDHQFKRRAGERERMTMSLCFRTWRDRITHHSASFNAETTLVPWTGQSFIK